MGFITDNIKGPSRLKRATMSISAPENQPPAWVTGVGSAVGAIALVGLIAFSVFSGVSGEEINATPPARQQNVIDVNPYVDPDEAGQDTTGGAGGAVASTPTEGTTEAEEAPAGVEEAGSAEVSGDFADTQLVTVGITDTNATAPIPAGARNLAVAGFEAMITGEWAPLPKTSAPVLPTPRSGATLDPDSLTITPASATSGGRNFTFTATFTDASGSPVKSQITVVSKADGSYQLRPL